VVGVMSDRRPQNTGWWNWTPIGFQPAGMLCKALPIGVKLMLAPAFVTNVVPDDRLCSTASNA